MLYQLVFYLYKLNIHLLKNIY